MVVGALAGCGTEECSLPRRGDELTCDSYDGGQLTLVLGDPLPNLSEYCASQCVDVFAPIAIAGYDDLRKVPLLPKVRLVQNLRVNLDGLKNLKGLENVDVVSSLTLFGQNGDNSPKTLEGLSDEQIGVFSIEKVTGLASLEGASIARVESLSVANSSVQRLDLSGVQASFVNVTANNDLRSLALASGEAKQVIIRVNSQLSELSWGSGMTVRNQLRVDTNSALSPVSFSSSLRRPMRECRGRCSSATTVRVPEPSVRRSPKANWVCPHPTLSRWEREAMSSLGARRSFPTSRPSSRSPQFRFACVRLSDSW